MPGTHETGRAVDGAVAALRQEIFDGVVRPGERLDEVSLGARLGLSRNTLRECFRVLAQQHLVVHEPNRGVFVRSVGAREGHEIYAARRVVECGAVREAAVQRALLATRTAPADGPVPPGDGGDAAWMARLADLRDALARGRAALAAGEWSDVGTANGDFHLALVRLSGNEVLAEMAQGLLTQMRLLFVDAAPLREVHERYVVDNEGLLALVEAGELVRVAVALEEYLLRAEDHLVEPLSDR